MAILEKLLTAAALAGLAAAPAVAQYQQYPQQYPQYPQQTYPQENPQYPQQGYPQTYPQQQYPQQGYPQQGYNYPNEGYGTTEGAVGAIVDSIIGNRYAVSDRQAIHSCAWAAVQRAHNQYRPYSPYGGGYPGYPGYGYGRYNNVRVTAITNVERRPNGVRVRGLLDSGYGNHPYDPRYGYGGGGYGYAGAGDLTFRCDVDYRGYVYDVRLDRNYYRSY